MTNTANNTLQAAFETCCALTADSNANPKDVTAAAVAFAREINAATPEELAQFHANNPDPVKASADAEWEAMAKADQMLLSCEEGYTGS